MSATVGSIIGGFLLTIFAGVCNGSWNAPFNPKLDLAVGRSDDDPTESTSSTTTPIDTEGGGDTNNTNNTKNDKTTTNEREYDLHFAHSWSLFQLYASIMNTIICLYWAGGPARVSFIVSQSSSTSIGLVVLFSFLWGIGSLLFGLACKIAGVGLGTNLTMCIVVILGTFLPMIREGVLYSETVAGIIICVGLFVCIVGLYYSSNSLNFRDTDEKLEQQGRMETEELNQDTNGDQIGMMAEVEDGEGENLNMSTPQNSDTNGNPSSPGTENGYSTVQKILICILAGTFAAQLQFAFVFGQEMVDIADINHDEIDGENGSTPSTGTASIIWLFAIPIGAVVSIAYGFYTAPKDKSFIKTLIFCPLKRHLVICLLTSLPWITHIHLYGLTTTYLLPEKLGKSLAWPLLMMTTIAQGMLLSIFMGEWSNASRRSLMELRKGLGVTLLGMIILMTSVTAL